MKEEEVVVVKEEVKEEVSIIKKIDSFIGTFSNLFNFIIGIITIFALIISIKSLQESMKAYTLSANGAKLETKLSIYDLNDDNYIDENDTIYVGHDSSTDDSIDTSVYIGDNEFKYCAFKLEQLVNNLIIENVGFVMSKNIYIQVRFKNAAVYIKDEYLDDNRRDYIGLKYNKSYYGSYVDTYTSVIDTQDAYQEKTWESKNFDKNIYPGQKISLDLFDLNHLYLYGDEAKMTISIVADQSEFIEKEYTIKVKNN